MSKKQDRKDIKTEQQEAAKATDELTGKELDQVVGGGVEPCPWLQGPQAQSGQEWNDDDGKLDVNPLVRLPHGPY